MPLVIDVKDLGSGVIGGVECDHLAFRTEEVDWPIWIAHGDAPYPCRFVVTSNKVAGSPQYTIDVSDWKAGSEVATADFAFAPPRRSEKSGTGRTSGLRRTAEQLHTGSKMMTRLSKRIAITVTALVVGVVGLELGEALSIPGVYGPLSSAEARVRTAAHAGERRGCGAPHRPALRCRRL